MLQRIWLAILFSSLAACAGMPEKPEGDLCTLRIGETLEASKGLCSSIRDNVKDTDDLHTEKMQAMAVKGKGRSQLPLVSMHKFICFSPDTWENVANYIDDLKAEAQKACPQNQPDPYLGGN